MIKSINNKIQRTIKLPKSVSVAQGTIAPLRKASIAQGTIEPPKAASIAQGTIEYLVIIAIVVVISLVVVALLLGIFESNSDVGTTVQSISTQTLPVALNEAILGTGEGANGLIVLTNNTGDIIRDVRVVIDGKDHNYFGINLAQGNKTTFQLNSLSIPCPAGQDKLIKTITIIYTTRNGLEQKQTIENVSLQCTPTPNPTATINPINENQQEETPGGVPASEHDVSSPTISGLSTVVYENNIRLYFTASDNNAILSFDKNRTDATTFVTANQTNISGNNYYTDFNTLSYSTPYTVCIKATDYNSNSTTSCTSATTGAEPVPELIIESLYMSPRGQMYVTLTNNLQKNIRMIEITRNTGDVYEESGRENRILVENGNVKQFEEDNFTNGTSQDYFFDAGTYGQLPEYGYFCTPGEDFTMDINFVYIDTDTDEEGIFEVIDYETTCLSGVAYYAYYHRNFIVQTPALPVLEISTVGNDGYMKVFVKFPTQTVHAEDKNYFVKSMYINDTKVTSDDGYFKYGHKGLLIPLSDVERNYVDTNTSGEPALMAEYCVNNSLIETLCSEVGYDGQTYANMKIYYDIIGGESNLVLEGKTYFSCGPYPFEPECQTEE